MLSVFPNNSQLICYPSFQTTESVNEKEIVTKYVNKKIFNLLSLFPNNFHLIYYLSFQTVSKGTLVLII